jgi:hypothetical protein
MVQLLLRLLLLNLRLLTIVDSLRLQLTCLLVCSLLHLLLNQNQIHQNDFLLYNQYKIYKIIDKAKKVTPEALDKMISEHLQGEKKQVFLHQE